MIVEFDGDVFRWDARTDSWFFAPLPEDLSEQIREIPRPSRGFGSVRVLARIGSTQWRTSIFPDSSHGAYVLPLKKAVRDAEGIVNGGSVLVHLEILDG